MSPHPDAGSKTGVKDQDSLELDAIDHAAAIHPKMPPFDFRFLQSHNRRRARMLFSLAETYARLLRRPLDESSYKPGGKSYEFIIDPLKEVAQIRDYTEGVYLRDTDTHDNAQAAQINLLIQATGARKGDRLLDVGCGSGSLIERCRELGIDASGVTVSRSQAIECQKRGLDVRLASFDEIMNIFQPNEFRAVVMNGSTEHFATARDALFGYEHDIWRRMFSSCAAVLQEEGRLMITALHCRNRQDARQVMKHPIDLGWQSEEFHWSILNRFYSGWYPTGDDYVLAAQESNFGLIREWDMTSHYARTSVDWAQQLSAAWREHRKEMSAIYMNLLNRDPRYFVITMFYTFYGTWMWQMLGGGESGAIHKWQLYNLTSP